MRTTLNDIRRINSSKSLGCKGFYFVLLMLAVPCFVLAQITGKKIRPSATVTIRIREIEKRENENKFDSLLKRKKIENENLIKEPRNLPVPKAATGKTYRLYIPQNEPNLLHKKQAFNENQPNFPAIGDNSSTIPPDMGGAVGPNHIMTALNSQVRIQDKAGGILSTVSLNGFFSALVTGFSVFDPKVLYDPFAQRWILTAPANSNSATSALLIAVSSTNNPTDPWTGYSFDVDAANTKWFDYPSIGFNRNWIVITGNLYQVVPPNTPDPFQNEQVYIFDKAAVYAGTAVPTVLNQPTSEGFTVCPAVTLDNTQNTEYLVSNYNGSSGGNGYLRIYTITGTPAAPVYSATSLFPNVSQSWATGPNATGADFAPQNTVVQKIQNNDARMQNAVFQNGSLWCAHVCFLPVATPTHSAAQWWQIDPLTATIQQFGRVEDAAAANFYAFPTIAVNAYNDALLGYSSYSATQFASCNYSFRLHTDPVNTMQPTVQFKTGLAKYYKIYSGSRNRWGDYSSTCIDPDNFTLWTLQEYAASPGLNDLWGTEWTSIVPPVPALYIKDRPEDVGAEPNPSALPMWESDDIWIRKLQDPGHTFAHMSENAEFRTGTLNPNFVYIEVRNRGAAISSATEQLNLYWAKASSGLSWPSPWTGGVFFDPGPNTMLMGNPIGVQTIPAIAPGGSTILEFAWSPPDPMVYTGPLAPDQNHFCLLGRITTGGVSPFGMTFPETSNLYLNVQNNNHIAWKNIHVNDLLPGTQGPAYAVISNLSKERMNAAIKFEVTDAEGRKGLLNKGKLMVTPSGKLSGMLQKGKMGRGIRQTERGSFEVRMDGAVINNILLNPKEFGILKIQFLPDNKEATGYAIRVIQLKEINGISQMVGGQTFVFGRVKGFGTDQQHR